MHADIVIIFTGVKGAVIAETVKKAIQDAVKDEKPLRIAVFRDEPNFQKEFRSSAKQAKLFIGILTEEKQSEWFESECLFIDGVLKGREPRITRIFTSEQQNELKKAGNGRDWLRRTTFFILKAGNPQRTIEKAVDVRDWSYPTFKALLESIRIVFGIRESLSRILKHLSNAIAHVDGRVDGRAELVNATRDIEISYLIGEVERISENLKLPELSCNSTPSETIETLRH